jgi:hypothetical protein
LVRLETEPALLAITTNSARQRPTSPAFLAAKPRKSDGAAGDHASGTFAVTSDGSGGTTVTAPAAAWPDSPLGWLDHHIPSVISDLGGFRLDETRTGLCRYSNQSLFAAGNCARKMFGEARDWADIFGDIGQFWTRETALSRVSGGKAAES